jgi:hypothetical protein
VEATVADPLEEAEKLLGTNEIVRDMKRRLDAALAAETTKDVFIGALRYALEKRKEEVSKMNHELARLKRMVEWLVGKVSAEHLVEFNRLRSQKKFDPAIQEEDD